MINFTQGGTFDLRKVPDTKLLADVRTIFIQGEKLVGVYQTVRDQVVFTNKRIITIDVEGLTGVRKDLFILPYPKIQYFGVRTPGLIELIPDAELTLYFANGMETKLEFKGSSDVLEIARSISGYML
ncbi:MAG: PH domain-containing protein [Anaerolineaceae bacterium]|nr:PH domain-containing protein [Anaerolineaceae bacterium]